MKDHFIIKVERAKRRNWTVTVMHGRKAGSHKQSKRKAGRNERKLENA